MEEYQQKSKKNKKKIFQFIDDSELEELTDDEITLSKEEIEKKEEEIEKKLQEFRKKHPIRYEN